MKIEDKRPKALGQGDIACLSYFSVIVESWRQNTVSSKNELHKGIFSTFFENPFLLSESTRNLFFFFSHFVYDHKFCDNFLKCDQQERFETCR